MPSHEDMRVLRKFANPLVFGHSIMLPMLAANVAAARLHVDGEPFPLPRGVDLSAYRIVQEALTNALKHANASDADVTVRYRPDEVEIEVRDNGGGVATNDGLAP